MVLRRRIPTFSTCEKGTRKLVAAAAAVAGGDDAANVWFRSGFAKGLVVGVSFFDSSGGSAQEKPGVAKDEVMLRKQ